MLLLFTWLHHQVEDLGISTTQKKVKTDKTVVKGESTYKRNQCVKKNKKPRGFNSE